MSGQNKNSRKKHTETLEKLLLATAIIQLITALVELIDKLLSG